MKHLIILIDKILIILLGLLYPFVLPFLIVAKMGYGVYIVIVYEMNYPYIINVSKKLYKTIFGELTKWQ